MAVLSLSGTGGTIEGLCGANVAGPHAPGSGPHAPLERSIFAPPLLYFV